MGGNGWFAGLLRFCLVGATGVAVNLAVFQGAFMLGAPLLAASAMAFVVAASGNFILNRLWTFRTAPPQKVGFQWARFLGASVAGLGANLAVLLILTGWTGAWYLLAQLAGICAGTVLNYHISRSWVFWPARSAAGSS
jgi:putative flippase GtrA